MLKELKLAAKYALSNSNDARNFLVGSIGVRRDGCIVHARNEAVFDTASRDKKSKYFIYKRFPESHAEARLTKKLGYDAIVYVARIAKSTGDFAMARPCLCCQAILKSYNVQKVYYSISPNEWGLWDPKTNSDIYYSRRY